MFCTSALGKLRGMGEEGATSEMMALRAAACAAAPRKKALKN